MKLFGSRASCACTALLVAGSLYGPESGLATPRPLSQLPGAARSASPALPLTNRDVKLAGRGDVRVTILLRMPSSLAARARVDRGALAPVPSHWGRSFRWYSRARLKRRVLRQALRRGRALARIAHAVPEMARREIRVLRRIARGGARVEAISSTARTVTAVVPWTTVSSLLRRPDV